MKKRATFNNDSSCFCLVENMVIKASTLWETNGAVIMAVRRPG